MKTMKCYDCEHTMQSETKEGMLDAFYVHYMAEHNAIITGADEEEKKAWMEKFDVDWEALEG